MIYSLNLNKMEYYIILIINYRWKLFLFVVFFLVISFTDLPARLLDNHTSLPVDPIFSAWQCDWEQQPKQLLFLWEKKKAEHLVWLKSFENHPLKYSQVRSPGNSSELHLHLIQA